MIGVVARAEERETAVEFFQLFKTPWEFYRPQGCYDVVIQTDPEFEHHLAPLVIAYGSHAGPSAHDGHGPPAAERATALWWNGDCLPLYGTCLTFPSPARWPRLVVGATGQAVT